MDALDAFTAAMAVLVVILAGTGLNTQGLPAVSKTRLSTWWPTLMTTGSVSIAPSCF